MFDFVRTHSRLMQGLLVLFIFPSFAFFGIQGYSRFTDETNATVATVDGRKITRAEWDQAHKTQVERMRQQMPNVDVRSFETPAMRQRTLDALVQDLMLRSAANSMHLAPSNERLQRLFITDPAMAGLRNADGTVNTDLLASQGMNSEMFAERLRGDYATRQVLGGLQQSALMVPAVTTLGLEALAQRRQIQYQRFDVSVYQSKIVPSEADLEAYYKAHEKDFLAPEQASIEYVTLDLAALGRNIALPEADLRKYYDENIARYTSAEERRASHILIKADKDLSAAERAKAKARAEALLAEVRKSPAGFAAMARKHSEDPGSAAQGGDLEFFGRGAMVKPFEDAVFSMKPGEISPVVESDFGYHIIALTGVRGGEKKPFDQVRAQIEAEVRQSMAQKRYAEAAEQFSEMVYQQYDSLQPVVDKLKLEKHTATVARTPAPGASGPLASQKLLEAVFSDESLKNKRNTEAIETGPNQMTSARVEKYEPAHTLPLAEVRARVRAAVIAQQAAALARKEGEARLAEAQKSGATLPNAATVSRAQTEGLPRNVIDAVLKADVSQGPVAIGVDNGNAGYVVVRVLKALPHEPIPGGDGPLLAQINQAWTIAVTEAYLTALKQRQKVELKGDVVAGVLRSASAP
jgi:peptidyl-prolyl cis-trans isomerase D